MISKLQRLIKCIPISLLKSVPISLNSCNYIFFGTKNFDLTRCDFIFDKLTFLCYDKQFLFSHLFKINCLIFLS